MPNTNALALATKAEKRELDRIDRERAKLRAKLKALTSRRALITNANATRVNYAKKRIKGWHRQCGVWVPEHEFVDGRLRRWATA